MNGTTLQLNIIHPMPKCVGQLDAYVSSLKPAQRQGLKASLSRVLRGQYRHRCKGKALRHHRLRKSDRLVETHQLIGVYPKSIGFDAVVIDPSSTALNLTYNFTFNSPKE